MAIAARCAEGWGLECERGALLGGVHVAPVNTELVECFSGRFFHPMQGARGAGKTALAAHSCSRRGTTRRVMRICGYARVFQRHISERTLGSDCRQVVRGTGQRFPFPRNSRAMAKKFTSRCISAGFPCRGHKGTAKFLSRKSRLIIRLSLSASAAD